MKNRKDTSIQAKTTAFCGMAAALSVALLMLTGMIPALGYVGPMLASIVLIPVFNNFGRRAAILTYVVTALLILILGADKEAAFFYIFFGYYPAVKPLLDEITPAFLRRLVKFLLFFVSAVLMDLILIKLLGITLEEAIPSGVLSKTGISARTFAILAEGMFCLMVALVMAMYDWLLSRLMKSRFFGKNIRLPQ